MQTTKRMKKQEWYHQQASASLSEPQQALASLREQTSESNQNFPSTRSFLTKEKHYTSFWLYFLAIFIFCFYLPFSFLHLVVSRHSSFPMIDYYMVKALSHQYVGAADEAPHDEEVASLYSKISGVFFHFSLFPYLLLVCPQII